MLYLCFVQLLFCLEALIKKKSPVTVKNKLQVLYKYVYHIWANSPNMQVNLALELKIREKKSEQKQKSCI